MRVMAKSIAAALPQAQVLVSEVKETMSYRVSIDVDIPMIEFREPEQAMDALLERVTPKGYVENANKYRKLTAALRMLGEEL